MYENLNSLKTKFVQGGKVLWIGTRGEKFAPLTEQETITVSPENGIDSDHYKGRSGKRHITLIQAEHLQAVASYLGKAEVPPGLVRRNILVSGINLTALIGTSIKIGIPNQRIGEISIGHGVLLEVTGHCHPCSRMEKNLGLGGYNAMRGHGGITARVLSGGNISLGDELHFAGELEDEKNKTD